MFNRFEVCEAYYIFLSENHEGQFSKKYTRLCRLLAYFTPSPFLSRDTLSENALALLMRLEREENQ